MIRPANPDDSYIGGGGGGGGGGQAVNSCDNLADIVRLVARLFQQVRYNHDITILLQLCIANRVTRLLARVLKEGVQFWYNDPSTVKRGGGSRNHSSGKRLMFTLLHVSICSKFVRNFQTHLAL
jgi:hypothetical protein